VTCPVAILNESAKGSPCVLRVDGSEHFESLGCLTRAFGAVLGAAGVRAGFSAAFRLQIKQQRKTTRACKQIAGSASVR